MRLLTFILDTLFPPRHTSNAIRTLSLENLLHHYTPVTLQEEPFVLTSCFKYHQDLIAALVQEAKFNGSYVAQQLLGEVLAHHIAERYRLTEYRIRLVPVPLSEERKKSRGYNQTQRIAEYAAKSKKDEMISFPEALVRVRPTLPQTSLSREKRLENVRGAFGAASNLDPTYLYIVIDDVVTTGATICAAVEALRDAGLPHVVAIGLAS
jgi:ComF family protein